mmetsp:Transcript_85/g.190  ORF Transcript_85/g.190 Transcript_85/m.190 type:complete len:339 (-) Transcript_85:552-1568(-)
MGWCRQLRELSSNPGLLSLTTDLQGQVRVVFLEVALIQHQSVTHRTGGSASTGCGSRCLCRSATAMHGRHARGGTRGGTRRHSRAGLLGIEIGSEVGLGRRKCSAPICLVELRIVTAEQRGLLRCPGDGILCFHEDRVLLSWGALWRCTRSLAIALHKACSGTVSAGCAQSCGIGTHLHDGLQLLIIELGSRERQSGPVPTMFRIVQFVDHVNCCRQIVLFQSLDLSIIVLSSSLFFLITRLIFNLLKGDVRQTQGDLGCLFWAHSMEADRGLSLQGNLLGIIPTLPGSIFLGCGDTGSLQLSPLLKGCQPSRLLELLLASLSLSFLTSRIRQTGSGL